jgi:carbonic anhydrase/acetyltransferase-like protein (isoleucine patch superfamily)
VLIGMGATVLNHAVIAEDCVVGAGALVTEGKTFPPRSLIVGAPARAVKTLSDEQLAGLRMSAAVYVEKAKHYRGALHLAEGEA